MKTPTGIPRIAPIRKPQATEPKSQPIRIPSTITAAVVPIRTEPAPAAPVVDGRGAIAGVLSVEIVSEFLTSPDALEEEHPAAERPVV